MPLLVASSVWGSEDRLLSIPPPRYTFSSSFSGDNLQFVAPVFNAERFAINLHNDVGSTISALFMIIGPFAVKWPLVLDALAAFSTRIMSVVLYSFYREALLRSFSHFFEEITKIQKPFANRYASAPIVWVSNEFFVKTSAFHMRPGSVSAWPTKAMGRKALRSGFVVSASTGFRIPTLQVAARDSGDISARAPAFPKNRSIGASSCYVDGGKLIERFASQINEFFVGRFCSVVYSNDSHCDAPNIVVGQKAAGARTLRGFRLYTSSSEQIANDNRLRIAEAA